MFSAVLLSVVLMQVHGMSLPPLGTAQATGYPQAKVELKITVTIVPNQNLTLNMEQVDPDIGDIYRVAVNSISTGMTDAAETSNTFLVIDNRKDADKSETMLAIIGIDGQQQLDNKEEVVVRLWSEDDPTVAMIREYQQMKKEAVAER